MTSYKVLLSLITESNDYQQQQARAAEEAAIRLGIELKIIYADSDAIAQSQQLLGAVQAKSDRPDAIVFEPVGTALAVVAKAAASAGIAWAVLNREVDYLPELRRMSKVPVFSIGTDHREVGRIQGRQVAALLPSGGDVLYIQGSISHDAAQQRIQGTQETKPHLVQLRTLKGQWTERSAYDSVASWLRLSTSHKTPIAAVVAQNDDMAIGARNAFQSETSGDERGRWLGLPFLGCDGLPGAGQLYVSKGLLRATVYTPPLADKALEMLADYSKNGRQPQEQTLVQPASYPALENLAGVRGEFATR